MAISSGLIFKKKKREKEIRNKLKKWVFKKLGSDRRERRVISWRKT